MSAAQPVTETSERSVVTVRAHASRLVAPALWLLLVSVATGLALGWSADRPAWVGWLFAVPAVGALLRGCVLPFLRWWTTTTELTSRRLSLRWGVVSRHGRDVPLRRVVDVALDRSVVQRLVGSGTLTLETAGDDDRLVLEGLPQPERLYRTLVVLVSEQTGPGAVRAGAAEHDDEDDDEDDDGYDDGYDDEGRDDEGDEEQW